MASLSLDVCTCCRRQCNLEWAQYSEHVCEQCWLRLYNPMGRTLCQNCSRPCNMEYARQHEDVCERCWPARPSDPQGHPGASSAERVPRNTMRRRRAATLARAGPGRDRYGGRTRPRDVGAASG